MIIKHYIHTPPFGEAARPSFSNCCIWIVYTRAVIGQCAIPIMELGLISHSPPRGHRDVIDRSLKKRPKMELEQENRKQYNGHLWC